MKVYFLTPWKNPKEYLKELKDLTPDYSGKWNNLEGTYNIIEADIIVILEKLQIEYYHSRYFKDKIIICFPREPLIDPIKNYEVACFKYGMTYKNFYHVLTRPNFINKSYNQLIKLKYTNREKILSTIVSNKNFGITYNERINFIKKLSKQNICDIYGAGWNKKTLGCSFKGVLCGYHEKVNDSSKTKYDALVEYKYSLCIENCQKENYFSEKFTDAILSYTIPIYYGCPNIDKYFPVNSFYTIDINSPNVFQEIKNIIAKDITNENIKALEEARNLILNKYNIWSSIENIVRVPN